MAKVTTLSKPRILRDVGESGFPDRCLGGRETGHCPLEFSNGAIVLIPPRRHCSYNIRIHHPHESAPALFDSYVCL